MTALARASVASLLLLLAACPTPIGERAPGGVTGLSIGALAVDPRTETTYVVRRSEGAQRLLAVRDDGSVSEVDEIAGADARLTFSEAGAVLTSTIDDHTEARLFGRESFELLESRAFSLPIRGFTTSSSGRFLASVGGLGNDVPVALLDASTLAGSATATTSVSVQLTWLAGRDVLLARSVTPRDDGSYVVRLRAWDVARVAEALFVTEEDGFWRGPTLDLSVATVGSAPGLVASPDDARAALDLVVRGESDDSLAWIVRVVDLASGEQRTVADVAGPLVFTPDGSTLIAFEAPATSSGASTEQRLVAIDVETLVVRPLDLTSNGPAFFYTAAQHWMLIATVEDDYTLNTVLYDLEMGVAVDVGSDLFARQFVHRDGELWALSATGLDRIPLASGISTPVPLSFASANLNILPRRDRIVLDDVADASSLHFFDPESVTVSSTAILVAP